MRSNPRVPAAKAGWHVSQFCKDAGISHTYFYTMDPALRPESVAVGRRRIVIESPADWLRRIKDSQEAANA